MGIEEFNHTIDIWVKEIAEYDFFQLCAKPSCDSWSLGQVIAHLVADTNYYIEQIKICVSTHDNAFEVSSPAAKAMFQNNDFPDEVIEGAPTIHLSSNLIIRDSY